jgi:hypothetical protein
MLWFKPKTKADPIAAHRACSNHIDSIKNSELCGCFYCVSIFSPDEIVKWIDQGQTAMCPKCDIDSVIGSASGFPITKEFLQAMNDHWFGESPKR